MRDGTERNRGIGIGNDCTYKAHFVGQDPALERGRKVLARFSSEEVVVNDRAVRLSQLIPEDLLKLDIRLVNAVLSVGAHSIGPNMAKATCSIKRKKDQEIPQDVHSRWVRLDP